MPNRVKYTNIAVHILYNLETAVGLLMVPLLQYQTPDL